MKRTQFSFPFYGCKGRSESNLRNELVKLLNVAQKKFTFFTFTTNATNFHSDGCICAVKTGDKARTRNDKTIVFCSEYGGSLPSCYAEGETQFDVSYIKAVAFIRANCKGGVK